MSKKKRTYADPTAEVEEVTVADVVVDSEEEEEKEGMFKKIGKFFKKHGKTIGVGAGALAVGFLLGGRKKKNEDEDYDDSEYEDEDEYDDEDFDEVNPADGPAEEA